MSTGQKYSGKGDSTSSAQQNSSTIEPTGEFSPQTATSADLAASTDTANSLGKLLSSSDLSPAEHKILLDLIASGVNPDLVIKTAQQLLQRDPTPTKPDAKPKGDIQFRFAISCHSRGGTSQADIIAFALEEYRTDRMKKAFNSVREGEFSDAYSHFQDSETATFTLFEMLLDATALADKNFWATQGEEPERNTDRFGYEHFLKNYLEIDPATIDQE